MSAHLPNIICVDVEDWYHPEYVKEHKSEFDVKPRIRESIKITLELLEKNGIESATFFIVGQIVEQYPEIVHEIVRYNHEIAFHGYYHRPLWQMNYNEFTVELKRYKTLIKSLIGQQCYGFRAPSYSLNNQTKWAITALKNQGFLYDSSIFPIRTPLYGEASAPIKPYHPSIENIGKDQVNEQFLEFPALVYPIAGLKIPAAGGFYLRTLPTAILKSAIKNMNMHGAPAVFSFHPWEVDLQTPRLKLGIYKSFVTYNNLSQTAERLSKILPSFEFMSFKNFLEMQQCL